MPAFSVLIVFVLLLIIGAVLLPLLNIQLNPSKSLPSAEVSYYWPNASARIVEQEVTSKLEGALNQIKGIEEISSVSKKGSGTVQIEFDKNTKLDGVRFEMAMVIRQLFQNFPDGVSYPQISLSTSGGKSTALLSYTLNAAASPKLIHDYADEQILPKIADVKGVSKVEIYGSTPFYWEIQLDAHKLLALGIDYNDVGIAINRYFNTEIVGMAKTNSNHSIQVSLKSFNSNKCDWNNIPIKKVSRRVVLLGQVAKVKWREKAPSSYYRINGLNTINVVVYGEKGVNSMQIVGEVKQQIVKIEEQLPPSYSMLLAYDETEFIEKELRKIGLRTIFSLTILLVFVLLVSRNTRYMFLILCSLVANLLIAVIFYYVFKIEIHIYSLAGITVSFGMIIDNSIIMIDHIRNKGNRKVFLAILAATLTTVGALAVIFLLPNEQRINLVDFALVVIINLSVSLIIALFFIPALYEKIPINRQVTKRSIRKNRKVSRFNTLYIIFIAFARKWRVAILLLAVLGFGLPVHLLPNKIEKETSFARAYNKTIGSNWSQNTMLPVAKKALGGSLRLFSEFVYEGNFYAEPGRTQLYVRGKMPEGCTIEQLNTAIKRMEQYIGTFNEVAMYQTIITSPQNAMITIHFNEGFDRSGFPYYLKELLTSKAISLGGLDWSVYGVGRGFSNALSSDFKSNRIFLTGYNYDRLYEYAEQLKELLRDNPRVRDLVISGDKGWSIKTLQEYYIDFDEQRLATYNIALSDFYKSMQNHLVNKSLGYVFIDKHNREVVMQSSDMGSFDVWDLLNRPLTIEGKDYKFSGFGKIDKRQTGNNIHKVNQEYQLTVAFDFVGPEPLAKKVIDSKLAAFEPHLAIGYKVKKYTWRGWGYEKKKPVMLLVIAFLIIYFVCAVLLESLLQPLCIIIMVPISFIGVFLSFYLFDFNFDQGGFASFILLAGIVVNAGLYIVNDFNQCRKSHVKNYIKSFNYKIIPIMLTIVSTILGLIPFVWQGQNEVFWFSFAIGAMGGLLFSIVALLVYLPLFLRMK